MSEEKECRVKIQRESLVTMIILMSCPHWFRLLQRPINVSLNVRLSRFPNLKVSQTKESIDRASTYNARFDDARRLFDVVRHESIFVPVAEQNRDES